MSVPQHSTQCILQRLRLDTSMAVSLSWSFGLCSALRLWFGFACAWVGGGGPRLFVGTPVGGWTLVLNVRHYGHWCCVPLIQMDRMFPILRGLDVNSMDSYFQANASIKGALMQHAPLDLVFRPGATRTESGASESERASLSVWYGDQALVGGPVSAGDSLGDSSKQRKSAPFAPRLVSARIISRMNVVTT